MARLPRILKAVGVANARRQKSLSSVASNNIFLMSLLLLQRNGVFVYVLIGLVLLFPMAADAWQHVPEERRKLWPLTTGEERRLRASALLLNPVAWIVLLTAVAAIGFHRATPGIVALAGGILAAGIFVPQVSGRLRFRGAGLRLPRWRYAPLVQKSVREMLGTLDFYCVLVISVGGIWYQIAHRQRLPDEGRAAMTMLLVVMFSSFAQVLFGFDRDGITRYRLWPLRGWQILLGKGLPYAGMVVLLTLPYSPIAGLTGGFMSLVSGHSPSTARMAPQLRWRFTTGGTLANGLVQTLGIGCGVAMGHLHAVYAVPIAILVYGGSLWWFGRRLEVTWGNEVRRYSLR